MNSWKKGNRRHENGVAIPEASVSALAGFLAVQSHAVACPAEQEFRCRCAVTDSTGEYGDRLRSAGVQGSGVCAPARHVAEKSRTRSKGIVDRSENRKSRPVRKRGDTRSRGRSDTESVRSTVQPAQHEPPAGRG